MSIMRFDDDSLPSLVCYFNAGEGTEFITFGSGDTVISVADAYGGPVTAVSKQAEYPDNHMYYDEATKINNCPTFYMPYSGSAYSGFEIDLNPVLDTTSGFTVASLIQRHSTSNYGTNWFASYENSTIQRYEVTRNGEQIRAVLGTGGTFDTGLPCPAAEPSVEMLTTTGQEGGGTFRANGSPVPLTPYQASPWQLNRCFWPCNRGTGRVQGRAALVVIYDGPLDATQQADVEELIQYWSEYGHAPDVNEPITITGITSAQTVDTPNGAEFSVTATGTPPKTHLWEAETSPGVWEDASTAFASAPVSTSDGLSIASTSSGDPSGTIRVTVDNAENQPKIATTSLTINSTEIPTNTSFGPVATVDKSAILQWVWSTAETGQPWNDIDGSTPLDPSIQWGIDTDGAQPGNLLNILSATAAQVVYLRCKATTNYEPGGIFSYVNTLTIVEAS